MRTYLRRKGPLFGRRVVDAETYRESLTIITEVIVKCILSKENNGYVVGMLIGGSWARGAGGVTGPTLDSDLDLTVINRQGRVPRVPIYEWLEARLRRRGIEVEVSINSDCFTPRQEAMIVAGQQWGTLEGGLGGQPFILVSPYPEVHERFRQWDELLNTQVAY